MEGVDTQLRAESDIPGGDIDLFVACKAGAATCMHVLGKLTLARIAGRDATTKRAPSPEAEGLTSAGGDSRASERCLPVRESVIR